MSSYRKYIIALALVLVPLSARGAEEQGFTKVRANNAEFRLPNGWVRTSIETGNTVFVPSNRPKDERVELHVGPFDFDDTRGIVEQANDGIKNNAKDFPDIRFTGRVRVTRHPGGFDRADVLAIASDKHSPSGKIFIHFTQLDTGGGTSSGYAFVTQTKASFDKYMPVYEQMVLSTSIPTSEVLVPRSWTQRRALTMYTVHMVTDFVEWALDVPFTEDQRLAFKQWFIDAWKKGDREEIAATDEIIKARLELDKVVDVRKKEFARQQLRHEIVKQWRQDAKDGDAMARLMIDIYDAAHEPLVAGDPPLTRQSADATLEILHFMACRAAGTPDVSPTAELKEQFAKQLTAAYAAMSKENREELAQMPAYWAALRVAWPELPKDQQQKLAEAWAQSEQVKPIMATVKEAHAKAQLDRNGQLDALQKYYRERQNFAMISNMMTLRHQTRMQIINNIGSSSYRYEYRYTYRYR